MTPNTSPPLAFPVSSLRAEGNNSLKLTPAKM